MLSNVEFIELLSLTCRTQKLSQVPEPGMAVIVRDGINYFGDRYLVSLRPATVADALEASCRI